MRYFSIGLFMLLGPWLLAQAAATLTDQVSVLSTDLPLTARSQLGGVTVDRLGFVYVANFHDAVWKISPKGETKLLTDGLYGSSGNAIDGRGDLYQANFIAHSIVRIDRFGQISPFIDEGLSGPVGLVFDSDQNLYVCNFNQNNIIKVSSDKQISVFASGVHFNGPNGITIDPAGNLYVANFNSNDVIKIAPDGTSSVFATLPGVDGTAHVVHYNDRLFVTKIKSNRVYQINKTGEVRLLAGNGQTAIKEGPALEASFSAPNGIGVDAQSGELYINNVKGQWSSRKASTIEISKIKLLTITEMLSHHLDQNNQEAAQNAYLAYRSDPFTKSEDVVLAVGNLGWQYMAKRNVQAAITLFTLNSEGYPDRWQPFFNLGEVYKILGQPEKAKSYYEKALVNSPGNKRIMARLKS
ncbi:MAG: tetratricopeptide repeat protein [Saprospiraceae bacterium]|nr:tetratricopeptide repeat protein [Saprospiraceae bacterium]